MKTLDSTGRKHNIHGAFRINKNYLKNHKDLDNLKILLVDDIYTSGATLSECAGVLKSFNAAEVYFFTFTIG